MNQTDLDEAIKYLPSPANVVDDVYIVLHFGSGYRFIFQKEKYYITPQRVTLTMWKLKSIERL